jgi:hypothetical protein
MRCDRSPCRRQAGIADHREPDLKGPLRFIGIDLSMAQSQ